MATWCEACRKHVPQVQRLRLAFPTGRLGLYGVPADSLESSLDLEKYVQQFQPGYELVELPASELTTLQRTVKRNSRIPANGIPASVLLDKNNRVVEIFAGVPTVSEIAKLMQPR
jgi:thiol-disulfide isomerase/thioredoxin